MGRIARPWSAGRGACSWTPRHLCVVDVSSIDKFQKALIVPHLAIFVTALAFVSLAHSQTKPFLWPEPPPTLELQAVADLDQDPTGDKIGGGSVAEPAQWPASFYAT